MTTNLDLTRYEALSFDCYGTLIDWEAGIAAVLAPWAREQGLDLSDEELLLAYADNEAGVEREHPSALYPDVLALDATLPRLGVDRRGLLHVAQSLFHDHVPAKREGLRSVWINRRHHRPGWGATPEPTDEWAFDLDFNSMADFADAVDQAFTDARLPPCASS